MKRLISISLAVLLSSKGYGAISEKEAAKLGAELHGLGGEMAGNQSGTIPAFSTALPPFPPAVLEQPGKHLPNPYADEKPLHILTAKNYKAHVDKLTAGQVALFEKYPDTYKMKIYPTHRELGYDPRMYEFSKANATQAKLVSGGFGFTHAYAGVPFPIPQNGLEAIWNHIALAGPYYVKATWDSAAVKKGAEIEFGQESIEAVNTYQDLNGSLDAYSQSYKHGFHMTKIKLPKKQEGEIILVHEPLAVDYEDRKAWLYMPSVRRVRRAPIVDFDYPVGPGGLLFTDEGRMYAGSPERYNWELVDKQEKYIPFNNYDLDNPELTYKEILTPGHINPEHIRYELHRVWVVEAKLKENERHVIQRRTLYLGEDTWQVQVVDAYDAKGNLWRSNMQTMVIDPHFPGPLTRVNVFQDLISGDYAVQRLINEREQREVFDAEGLKLKKFTAEGLKRLVH